MYAIVWCHMKKKIMGKNSPRWGGAGIQGKVGAGGASRHPTRFTTGSSFFLFSLPCGREEIIVQWGHTWGRGGDLMKKFLSEESKKILRVGGDSWHFLN